MDLKDFVFRLQRRAFPLDPAFYRETYPELNLTDDNSARTEWERAGWSSGRTPSRFALSVESFLRMRRIAKDVGVFALHRPEAVRNGAWNTGKLAIRSIREKRSRHDSDPINLPPEYFARLEEVSAKSILSPSSRRAVFKVSSFFRPSDFESQLAKYPADIFLLESFRFFNAYPPSYYQFHEWLSFIEFGHMSRSAALSLIIGMSPFEVETIPSEISFELVLSASAQALKDRPSFEQTHIKLLGKELMPLEDWYAEVQTAKSSSALERINQGEKDSTASSGRGAEEPRVAVIGSLFRSDEFLLQWIQNVESQTIFADCEVAILSVDPSEFERHELEEFANRNRNVILEYHDRPFGIYEAWNRAVEITSAPLLTNMNADDLRRLDSLEKQVAILEQYDWVDVAYQDVTMTLDARLPWHVMERAGAVSALPITTTSLLLSGPNPPHNGPIWRRRLHDELGLFDTSFRSAGDYEFWVRCSRAGKVFFNVSDPHVGYFENPEGLSTAGDGVGVIESRRVHEMNHDFFTQMDVPAYVKAVDASRPRIHLADRVTAGFIQELGNLRVSQGSDNATTR